MSVSSGAPETPDDGVALTALMLRRELEAWRPRHGPDLRDLMRRADTSWQRPLARVSAAGAALLGLALGTAVVVILSAPVLPAVEIIRERLLAH